MKSTRIRLEIWVPIDLDNAPFQIHFSHVLPDDERDQKLAVPANNHDIVCACGQHVCHDTKLDILDVRDLEPQQVDPVIMTWFGSGKFISGHQYFPELKRLCLIPVVDTLQLSYHHFTLAAPSHHLVFLVARTTRKYPRRIIQDVFRRIGVGVNFYPPFNSMGSGDFAHNDLPNHINTESSNSLFGSLFDQTRYTISGLGTMADPVPNTLIV